MFKTVGTNLRLVWHHLTSIPVKICKVTYDLIFKTEIAKEWQIQCVNNVYNYPAKIAK